MEEHSISADLSFPDKAIIKLPQPCGTQDAPSKPTTFHRFSCLPQELQNAIWAFVILDIEPRIIIDRHASRISFAAPYGAPPILHVCSAARIEALKRYPPLIASRPRLIEYNYYHVNFSTDIVFAGYICPPRRMVSRWGCGTRWLVSEEERCRRVRNVAVGTHAYVGVHGYETVYYSGRIDAIIPIATPEIVDRLMAILEPYLATKGALEEVLLVPTDPSGRLGEMGFMSLEKEELWLSDFEAYGREYYPQLLETLLRNAKRDFEMLRVAEKVLQQEWGVRMESLGRKVGIRFVHQFFVTERNNWNEMLKGEKPLRERYYVPR